MAARLFLFFGVAWLLYPVRFVVARAEVSGRIVAAFPASHGDGFSLTYLHSVYRQPASEDFVVDARGFSLARLASPSEAVLEYYARREPIVRTATGYELRPAGTRRVHVESLRVLASVEGARTLVMGIERAPLFATGPPGLPRPFDTLRVAPSFVDGSTLPTIDPEPVERVEGRAMPGTAESRGRAVIISVARLPRVARWLCR